MCCQGAEDGKRKSNRRQYAREFALPESFLLWRVRAVVLDVDDHVGPVHSKEIGQLKRVRVVQRAAVVHHA